MPARIQSRLILLLLLSGAAVGSAQAQGGLRLDPAQVSAFKARIHLMGSDRIEGERLLGAQLLGDYFPLGPASGLRLSGGMLLGPSALLGTGLAPDLHYSQGALGLSRRTLRGFADEPLVSQPYLGVGYSLGSAKGGWGVSADLGVAVSGGSGLRLSSGSEFAQSLDASLRRLQWTPLLQVGVSYRF